MWDEFAFADPVLSEPTTPHNPINVRESEMFSISPAEICRSAVPCNTCWAGPAAPRWQCLGKEEPGVQQALGHHAMGHAEAM